MKKDYSYVYEVLITFDKNEMSEAEVEEFVDNNFEKPIKVINLQGHNLKLEWPTFKGETFPIQTKMQNILKDSKLAKYSFDLKDCSSQSKERLSENITLSKKDLKEIFADKGLHWREKEDYFLKSGRNQLGETAYDYINDEDYNQMIRECGRKMTETEVEEFREELESQFDFDENEGKILGFSNYGLEYFDGFLEIPETIKGVTVKTIGEFAFNNKSLTFLILPPSLVNIEVAAFAYNYLSDLSIPKNVEVIGDYAFADNELKTVNLSKKLKELGSKVFSNNSEDLKIRKY